MRVLRCLVLLGLVVMTLDPARAVAQPVSTADKAHVAKQYVDAALAAQNTGDYDIAITLYEKAYQLVPHPVLLFNMAQAHRLAGRIDVALALYARYLAKDPSGAQAQIARELVTELEARKAQQARPAKEARKPQAARKASPERSDAEDESPPERRAATSEGEERAANREAEARAGNSEAGGTLIVHARSGRGGAIKDGTVIVDDKPRGSVAGGTLTVPGITVGRHTVAIDAGGYRRFEDTVTVHDGEPARLDALLVEKLAPSPPRAFPLWKVSLGTSLAVGAAGFAYSYYSNSMMLRHTGNFEPAIDPATGLRYTSGVQGTNDDDCGLSAEQIAATKHSMVTSQSNFDRACTWRSRIYIGYVATGVGVVGAVVSLILLTRNDGSSEPSATGADRKKSEVAIMPILAPGAAGASLSLRW